MRTKKFASEIYWSHSMAIVIYNFLLPWSNFYENFTTVSTIISFFETFFKASITMFSRNVLTISWKSIYFYDNHSEYFEFYCPDRWRKMEWINKMMTMFSRNILSIREFMFMIIIQNILNSTAQKSGGKFPGVNCHKHNPFLRNWTCEANF